MKDGIKKRLAGSNMSGPGLKKKYRAHPDEGSMKGKQTKGKK